MALFNTLFGKKKKEFTAACQITKEPIEKNFGYLLTTAQVVTSKKYWDMIMTEPETLSYTVSHFKNQSSGTQMRTMIFEKYATIAKAWIVSDSIINYFDVDKTTARENAKKWWASEGAFAPENIGPASQTLEENEFTNLKKYAILEAGRSRMAH
ncbi:MAG TPA: hypothetical protein PLM56_05240 [Cyclobacteriaceae bacterium]|jgi:hypothetical protein|nr:hypothetical protein [Cytophagales bacterium]HMR57737.1 hypothetical protein [Cyclobacteriaceae bacterium]HNT50210.1 hypothetical protein [Cyclobacteriaceae bacterium]HRE66301.1 hypothetical protein [Cyclobacteriaceae bacterium]HRF32877.1 hypothetical protein [Cyclobacteriaceae bacterium]